MAWPSSMYVETQPRFKGAGITVEVYPSTVRGLKVELQAATANSTASSVWVSHIFGPSTGGPLRYTVKIPESTRPYYFRARHPAGNGFSAGPWTPTISARPKITPDIIRPFVMQMTYQGNVETPSGSDVFVSSAKQVKVGTQPTTGTYSKTIRIGFDQVLPSLNTETWTVNSGYLAPNAASVTRTYIGAVILPKGITIKSFASRMRRQGSGGSITNTLVKGSSTGGAGTTLATNTATTLSLGSFTTITKTTLSQLVGDNEVYRTQVQIFTTNNTNPTAFMYAEIGYTQPALEKSV